MCDCNCVSISNTESESVSVPGMMATHRQPQLLPRRNDVANRAVGAPRLSVQMAVLCSYALAAMCVGAAPPPPTTTQTDMHEVTDHHVDLVTASHHGGPGSDAGPGHVQHDPFQEALRQTDDPFSRRCLEYLQKWAPPSDKTSSNITAAFLSENVELAIAARNATEWGRWVAVAMPPPHTPPPGWMDGWQGWAWVALVRYTLAVSPSPRMTHPDTVEGRLLPRRLDRTLLD